jgi:hypothetical protein
MATKIILATDSWIGGQPFTASPTPIEVGDAHASQLISLGLAFQPGAVPPVVMEGLQASTPTKPPSGASK